MENIILKIVACICVTIISAILARNAEEDKALILMGLGLAMIFIPWDKVM